MSDKKSLLLQQSLNVFNQHGCQKISFRQLASELSMSHGNLAYHYKTKDLVIKALYEKFVTEITTELERSIKIDWNFEEVILILERMNKIIQHYIFVFKDLYFIKSNFDSPETKVAPNPDQEFGYIKIQELHKKGFLREEEFTNEYRMVAKQIEWLTNYLYIEEYDVNIQLDEDRTTENFITYVFPIYKPYLTEKGKENYVKALEKYYNKNAENN